MIKSETAPPYSGDTQAWAEDLSNYLGRTKSKLAFKGDADTAKDDGIILWDQNGYPVVSKNGEYRQIVLSDGHGDYYINSDLTFAAANTAYAITFSASPANHGISQSGAKFIFEESGHYLIGFSAQIYSTSASAKDFVFWPRLNGSNLSGSAIKASLEANGQTTVISRSVVFALSAGDELEVMGAVSSTAASLKAFPANVIATEPATPSSTLSILRIHQ